MLYFSWWLITIETPFYVFLLKYQYFKEKKYLNIHFLKLNLHQLFISMFCKNIASLAFATDWWCRLRLTNNVTLLSLQRRSLTCVTTMIPAAYSDHVSLLLVHLSSFGRNVFCITPLWCHHQSIVGYYRRLMLHILSSF